MPDLTDQIFRARLNYQKIQELTNWDHLMVNDYLGITSGTLSIAEQIDLNTSQIEQNTGDIEENSNLISALNLTFEGYRSYSLRLIGINTDNIATNSNDIASNSLRIDDLEQLANRV